MLYVTLEMRHQPFFGWIQDLSARDPTSLFNLFGLIPWDPPTFLMIGAWPILMGLSMWVQQKLNPTPPDPIQAKIFMFFPTFFNNNIGSISIRISCVLDCKQHINYCAAMGNYERNKSKNGLDN